MRTTASTYGTADSSPVAAMPTPAPALTIVGSQNTNPYTPTLHSRYCTESTTTVRLRRACRYPPTSGRCCCSSRRAVVSAARSSSGSQAASAGRSAVSATNTKAQMIAGTPSRTNIHCQLVTETSQPDRADNQSTVTGLPRMSTVSVRPRSRLVNQWVRNTSIAGRIAASTTPSRSRTTTGLARGPGLGLATRRSLRTPSGDGSSQGADPGAPSPSRSSPAEC